ncbi:unnamed protein product [Kluyveromyces dobzhanskii CBS 2104]|uniref:WGS project CCBQ000000000 data, contig 00099 n=1 Tax=Kluyveromyces dobzhanskii CBS 2104 TaxID=1427455 RepID=A0A0A8L1L4_9SACH|nr:unnamed protein product [Kluyveromyces dobzhanskii CBS 2104]
MSVFDPSTKTRIRQATWQHAGLQRGFDVWWASFGSVPMFTQFSASESNAEGELECGLTSRPNLVLARVVYVNKANRIGRKSYCSRSAVGHGPWAMGRKAFARPLPRKIKRNARNPKSKKFVSRQSVRPNKLSYLK